MKGTKEEVENVTIKSFWAAMSRSDELEPVGRGTYRLKSTAGHIPANQTESHPKPKPRSEQLKDFLKSEGPQTRQQIIAKSGIPLGTLGMLLQKEPFRKDEHGRWFVP